MSTMVLLMMMTMMTTVVMVDDNHGKSAETLHGFSVAAVIVHMGETLPPG